jgi:hypothetical protein
MDGRRERTNRTRAAILNAIERLKNGSGTHPLHLGVRVRITKQAVAREARVSSANLYRYPDLVMMIGKATGQVEPRVSNSAQRRTKLLAELADRERTIEKLICENYRLMNELEKYGCSAGKKDAVDIASRRRR